MLRTLRNRDFGLLWFGGLVSYTGNWATIAAVPFFVFSAENAPLPRLVGRRQLMAADSLNSLNANLARIAGPAIGGRWWRAGGSPAWSTSTPARS